MHVTVIGGGLAGMIAALRLAERGFAVDLYESTSRLGGKAGCNQHGSDFDEHGYHIFPMWCRNIWKLVDELGIAGHFADVEDFVQIERGEFPRNKTLTNLGSARYVFHNLFSGVLPVEEMALFFYSTLDLMSHRFSYRRFLDQTSVKGFVRGRIYRTERVVLQHQDLLLKGINVPSYAVSAMTMRNVLKYWFKYPLPMHRVLKGNLQQLWIEPIEKRMAALGVKIHLGQRLERIETAQGRVTAVHLNSTRHPVERAVVAIPWERLAAILDDDLYRAAPKLFAIRGLNSAAMAALNIYFRGVVPGMPKDHVNVIGGRYGLSFIDVGQWWPEYRGRTVLNAISSNFTALESVSEDVAVREMLDELFEFIPALRDVEIEKTDFQPHVDEPLFMNEVGAWQSRPGAKTELPNLYLAGDCCRNHIDLVSMEGAVSAGLLAAEAVRKDAGSSRPGGDPDSRRVAALAALAAMVLRPARSRRVEADC
ncbi:MAG: FAD-binding protein [Acidobacteria bacterium]|nr:FAD-binding protein [Acidobacteriota bacterium]